MSSESRIDEQAGRCWGCGYLLRGVESGKCPECGRPFDPAERASMNFGLPVGGLQRRMLAPVGWWTMLLAVTAVGLIWASVRRPGPGWRFSFLDLRYYGKVWEWGERFETMNWIDLTYVSGLLLGGLVLLAWLVRLVVRGLARVRFSETAPDRARFWRRGLVLMMLLVAMVAGIGMGWPARLGERWVDNFVKGQSVLPVMSWGGRNLGLPVAMSAEDELTIMRAAILHGSRRRTRIGGLKLLMEDYETRAPEILAQAVGSETDDEVKRLEARLIGITGGMGSEALLKDLLNDPQAAAREGAADGMGIWRRFAYPLNDPTFLNPPTIDSDPPISIPTGAFGRRYQIPAPGTREALEKMMLSGEKAEEREAAARALLNWPPVTYSLRYAEWGVFMADPAGKLPFVKEQLDELPPFVHRIGNPSKELAKRIGINMTVWKPVIHLTASTAMVVDLEATIGGGRPWVAYPRIDDLALGQHSSNTTLQAMAGSLNANGWIESLDPAGLANEKDLREGYPWLTPHHRMHAWQIFDGSRPSPNSSFTVVGAVGVRWQSLIVSPKKLEWMRPANVPVDPRFGWWKRLRDVDCSWVSSRGESERFLYYDGPSLRRAPVEVSPIKDSFVFHGVSDTRPAIYLQVTPAGIRLQWIREASPRLEAAGDLKTAAAAKAELTAALEARGLTHSEAAGLVDCWEPAFFRVAGQRLLTLMTPADYDEACPMTISPKPTQRVRVGIVWTELGG